MTTVKNSGNENMSKSKCEYCGKKAHEGHLCKPNSIDFRGKPCAVEETPEPWIHCDKCRSEGDTNYCVKNGECSCHQPTAAPKKQAVVVDLSPAPKKKPSENENMRYDRFIRHGLASGFTDDQIDFLADWILPLDEQAR